MNHSSQTSLPFDGIDEHQALNLNFENFKYLTNNKSLVLLPDNNNQEQNFHPFYDKNLIDQSNVVANQYEIYSKQQLDSISHINNNAIFLENKDDELDDHVLASLIATVENQDNIEANYNTISSASKLISTSSPTSHLCDVDDDSDIEMQLTQLEALVNLNDIYGNDKVSLSSLPSEYCTQQSNKIFFPSTNEYNYQKHDSSINLNKYHDTSSRLQFDCSSLTSLNGSNSSSNFNRQTTNFYPLQAFSTMTHSCSSNRYASNAHASNLINQSNASNQCSWPSTPQVSFHNNNNNNQQSKFKFLNNTQAFVSPMISERQFRKHKHKRQLNSNQQQQQQQQSNSMQHCENSSNSCDNYSSIDQRFTFNQLSLEKLNLSDDTLLVDHVDKQQFNSSSNSVAQDLENSVSVVPLVALDKMPLSVAQKMKDEAKNFVLAQASEASKLKKPGFRVRRTLRIKVPKTKPMLGIAIEGGFNVSGKLLPRVVCVHEEGAAFECGQLRVGDLILQVNNKSTVNLSHEDIAKLIANAYYTNKSPYIEFLIGESLID